MRPSSSRTIRAGLPFLALALVALGLFVPALQGDLFFPMHTDVLEPWRSSADPARVAEAEERFNPEVTDKNFLFHPDTERMVDEWRAGRIPLWNPALLGGVSQIGQALIGALYPPNALMLAFDSLEQSYAWLAALHVFLAGAGVFLLLRRWGLDRGPALFGAIAFAISGPLIVRYHYYMTFYPVVWIPWLWWAVERYVDRPALARWLAIVPFPALVVLTGFPQTGLYGIYLCGIWGTLRLLARRSEGLLPIGGLGAAFALAGALTAAQVLPVLEVQERSLSRDRSAEQQLLNAGSPWLPSGYLVPKGFVDPSAPVSASWLSNPLWSAFYARVDTGEDGTQRPRLEPVPRVTEDSCYAGALALVLAVLGIFARPRRRALALGGALAVCWAYALGFAPLVHFAHRFVPGADMGDVRRILPTAALLVALLAALGLERFLKAGRGARWTALGVSGSISALLAAAWMWTQRLGTEGVWAALGRRIGSRTSFTLPDWTPETREQFFAFLSGRLQDATLWAALGFALLGLAMLLRRRPALSIGLLTVGLCVDLGNFHYRLNPFVPAEGFLRDLPMAAAIRADSDGQRIHRYCHAPRTELDLNRDAVLPNNLSLNLGLEDSAGYIVAVPERWARYLRAIQPEPDHVVTVLVYPLGPHPQSGRPECLTSTLLDHGGIRHLLTRDDVPALLAGHEMDPGRWTLLHDSEGNRVYANRHAAPFAAVHAAAAFHGPATDDEDGEEELHRAILQRLREGGPDVVPPQVEGEASRLPLLSGEDASASKAPRHGVDGASAVRDWSRPSAGEVEVQLDPGDGGLLVLNQGYDPGWRAWVDGEEVDVLPANVAFQSVELPADARRVHLRYDPPAFRRGARLSLSALLLWVVLALVALALPAAPGPRSGADAAMTS